MGGSVNITEILYSIFLAVAAFWLGACPFSLWIGKRLLSKDIRRYGDGNPGATNVFRAGSIKIGIIALVLDIAKGTPFILVAHLVFGLPQLAIMAIGISAILGHAYSPILRFKGGKALAVTGGVLLALPQHEMIISVLLLTFLGFLLTENDAWPPIFGITGSLIYLLITKGIALEPLFMACVLIILVVKYRHDLREVPKVSIRPLHWLRARRANKATNVGH